MRDMLLTHYNKSCFKKNFYFLLKAICLIQENELSVCIFNTTLNSSSQFNLINMYYRVCFFSIAEVYYLFKKRCKV